MIKKTNNSNNIKIYEAYISKKCIKDINTNDELKPLISIVGKWRFYIGIKDELTQDEILMNINFIRENFNDLNIEDINQAINLSLNGKLEVDVEHYNSFTPMYISRILLAYRKYRGEVIVSIRNQISKIENEKPKIYSEEDKLRLAKDNLNLLFNSKDDDKFYDYGSVCYDFIKKNKLIVFTKSLVDEAMQYGVKKARNNKQKSAYKDAILDTKLNYLEAIKKEEAITRIYARIFVVKKWLNSFNENNWKKFIDSVNEEMI